MILNLCSLWQGSFEDADISMQPIRLYVCNLCCRNIRRLSTVELWSEGSLNYQHKLSSA